MQMDSEPYRSNVIRFSRGKTILNTRDVTYIHVTCAIPLPRPDSVTHTHTHTHTYIQNLTRETSL
jgi:hypothetical protein